MRHQKQRYQLGVETSNFNAEKYYQDLSNPCPSSQTTLILEKQGRQLLIEMEDFDSFQKLLSLIIPYVVQIQKIKNRYQLGKELGKGGYGSVILATRFQKLYNADESNSEISVKLAVKKLDLTLLTETDQSLQHTKQEINTHWQIKDCPSIVQLREVFISQRHLYIVIDYQEGGSITEKLMELQKMKEEQTKVLMMQLLLALDFMHKREIVHRDIKLDNILLNKVSEGHFDVKIADFGLAAKLSSISGVLTEICGSAGYIAPEILRELPYDEKVDIFSLGSVFFNFMTGCFLFSGNSEDEVLKNNTRCNTANIETNLRHYSRLARDLFLQMVKKDPKQRPSAENALKHPWFGQEADQSVINEIVEFNRSQVRDGRNGHSANGSQQSRPCSEIRGKKDENYGIHHIVQASLPLSNICANYAADSSPLNMRCLQIKKSDQGYDTQEAFVIRRRKNLLENFSQSGAAGSDHTGKRSASNQLQEALQYQNSNRRGSVVSSNKSYLDILLESRFNHKQNNESSMGRNHNNTPLLSPLNQNSPCRFVQNLQDQNKFGEKMLSPQLAINSRNSNPLQRVIQRSSYKILSAVSPIELESSLSCCKHVWYTKKQRIIEVRGKFVIE
ncbi:hypothetical protein FGO68_gene14086 [Halteria grandinella]|uniref:Protein kinase domain-containing protein n=1 Tax=Halteria grandinella TaxID=5974 RepID=A0A8J8P408_HALGN|nr:hypothetical protein FGO68_gene14086 [Halteria grandinella]